MKRDLSQGVTDELWRAAVENGLSTHVLKATILYLLGLDQEARSLEHN